MTPSQIEDKTLRQYFKIAPHWDYPDPFLPDELLEKISFVFTMGRAFHGLYFKLKEPLSEGVDCFQFAFDMDNGIYVNDGDMRFNDFMGKLINDSGADIIPFIKQYMIEHNFEHLILKP